MDRTIDSNKDFMHFSKLYTCFFEKLSYKSRVSKMRCRKPQHWSDTCIYQVLIMDKEVKRCKINYQLEISNQKAETLQSTLLIHCE